MRKLRPKLRPRRIWTARIQKYCKSVEKRKLRQHGPSFLPAKLRPWSELTAKMVMGVVPGLAIFLPEEGGSPRHISLHDSYSVIEGFESLARPQGFFLLVVPRRLIFCLSLAPQAMDFHKLHVVLGFQHANLQYLLQCIDLPKSNVFQRIQCTTLPRTGQFQVQVCPVTERVISWQVHVSLVLKAFGPPISLMSWEWTTRNAANRHLELPGRNHVFQRFQYVNLHESMSPVLQRFELPSQPQSLHTKFLTSFVVTKTVTVIEVDHVFLKSVQQIVSGELAGEYLQTGFERHGLPPQRAPLDTVYLLREHLNSVQRMVSGGYCEGLFPDTVCWTRLRNTGGNSPE